AGELEDLVEEHALLAAVVADVPLIDLVADGRVGAQAGLDDGAESAFGIGAGALDGWTVGESHLLQVRERDGLARERGARARRVGLRVEIAQDALALGGGSVGAEVRRTKRRGIGAGEVARQLEGLAIRRRRGLALGSWRRRCRPGAQRLRGAGIG